MMTSERSLHPIWSGIVLLLIGSACGKGDRPIVPDGTDSAGVEIINNRTPDRALAWSFREILRLGGDDAGPASFYEIDRNLVAVDERGHLYVLDGQDFTVAEFDAEGGAMRTLGGEGGGPGQFQRPFGVAVTASGRVVVNDYGKQSLVRFAPDGTVLDQMPAPRTFGTFFSDDDRVVLHSRQLLQPEYTYVEVIYSIAGADSIELVRMPSVGAVSTRFESCGFPIGRTGMPLFYKELVWHANRSTIAVNREVGYVVDVFDATGRLFKSIRRDWTLRPATLELAMKQALEDPVVVSRASGGQCITDPKEVAEKTGWEEYVPLLRNLALAPDGTLWVERWTWSTEPRLVDVFDDSGTYLGTLTGDTPWPLQFTPNGDLVTKTRDEVDIERLVVVRVTR